MDRKLFIDATAWINFVLIGEPHHEEAVTFLRTCIEEGKALFTSNDIVDETITRLRYRVNFKVANDFFQLFQRNVKQQLLTQLWVDEQLQFEAWDLLKKFREHKLSFTDATSIAIIKRFKLDAIITFDADFKKVGMRILP